MHSPQSTPNTCLFIVENIPQSSAAFRCLATILLELERLRSKVWHVIRGRGRGGGGHALASQGLGGGERERVWVGARRPRRHGRALQRFDPARHLATHPEVVEGGGGEALPGDVLGQRLHHAGLLQGNLTSHYSRNLS